VTNDSVSDEGALWSSRILPEQNSSQPAEFFTAGLFTAEVFTAELLTAELSTAELNTAEFR
jgi:hypothetical protein